MSQRLMTFDRRREIEDMLMGNSQNNRWMYGVGDWINVVEELLETVDLACSFTVSTCEGCGNTAVGRSTRRWCSDACKSKAYRQRLKAN